jgi:hypothetical protein
MTCKDPQSMIAWLCHLEDAAMLLNARERYKPKDRTGLRVFLQLRSQLVSYVRIKVFQLLTPCWLMSCLQRGTAVPATISKWSERYKSIMAADKLYESRLADIIARLANARAAIISQNSLDSDEVESILLAIDCDLEKWSLSLLFHYLGSIRLVHPLLRMIFTRLATILTRALLLLCHGASTVLLVASPTMCFCPSMAAMLKGTARGMSRLLEQRI